MSNKLFSNAFKCSFFGSTFTDLKRKLSFNWSLDSEFLSKKNAFHFILFMTLSSLKIKFFWLNAFDNNLYDMVRNIEFKNVKSPFQHQLQNDVKRIKQEPKLLIPADKTNNLYRLTTDEYKKLLTENISKSYKKLINL